MTEVVEPGISDTQPIEASGSGEVVEPKPDTVNYETHRKLLGEKKKLQARLTEIEAQGKAEREKVLAEQGEYKDLYTQSKEQVEALTGQLNEATERQNNFVKLRAVLSAIDGKIDQDYYGHLGIENVLLDPDTGEVDKMSVSKVVEAFKAKHSVLIQGNRPANLPKDAPQYANGTRKFEDLKLHEKTADLGERMRNL